jgi:hypothetical protein
VAVLQSLYASRISDARIVRSLLLRYVMAATSLLLFAVEVIIMGWSRSDAWWPGRGGCSERGDARRYVVRMRWGMGIGWSGGRTRCVTLYRVTADCLLDLSQHLDCLYVAQGMEVCCDVDGGDAGDFGFFFWFFFAVRRWEPWVLVLIGLKQPVRFVIMLCLVSHSRRRRRV